MKAIFTPTAGASKKSNCHLYAWRIFQKGDAKWMAFRHTNHPFLTRFVDRWYWIPFKATGIVLMWLGSIITAIGWFGYFGHIYHMTWITEDGEHKEFVPESDIDPSLPKLPDWQFMWFAGKVRKVEK